MQKQRLYRIVTFAGWFLSFIGIALLSLFAVYWVNDPITAGIILTILGLAMALSGETMLSQHADKLHRFIWEALSIGGIFSLSIGLLWLAVEFTTIQSVSGIIILLLLGTALVLFGESGVLKENERAEKKPVIKIVRKAKAARLALLVGALAILLPTLAFAATAKAAAKTTSGNGVLDAGICMISTCGAYSLLYIIVPVIAVYIYKQFINPL